MTLAIQGSYKGQRRGRRFDFDQCDFAEWPQIIRIISLVAQRSANAFREEFRVEDFDSKKVLAAFSPGPETEESRYCLENFLKREKEGAPA